MHEDMHERLRTLQRLPPIETRYQGPSVKQLSCRATMAAVDC